MSGRLVGAAGLICASLALGGCVSSSREPAKPKPRIKQSVATAPADLQLLCSAEAAKKFGFRQDEILPVGSDAISPNIFRVDVRTETTAIRCVANRQAQILELVEV